jgi:pyridoxamine 5'-phosphate oxidase
MDAAALDPIAQFSAWYAEARRADPQFHDAMCLSTVGAEGRPAGRMVLLKSHDARGFVFFTNLGSRKGRELGAHRFAALTFHWSALERQVRIEGPVEPVSEAEADAYFASRPRGSQLGAWASLQSERLEARALLSDRYAEFERRFEGQPVPRPPHWSGYRVVPERIEFWQGLPSRLHDRTVYVPSGGGWVASKLFP